MAAYKKLLVPLDGSRTGEVVFPFVRELASRLGLETTCLHICESEEDQFAPMHGAYTKWVADTLKRQSADAGREIKVQGEVVTATVGKAEKQ